MQSLFSFICLFFCLNLQQVFSDPINDGVAIHDQNNPQLEQTLKQPPQNKKLETGFASSFEKVYLAPPYNYTGEFSAQTDVYLARNEYESVQLVLFPFRDLSGISLKATNFVHERSKVLLNAKHIRLRPVGFVSQLATHYKGNRSGWHPDPLFPDQTLQLKKAQPQTILVSFFAARDTIAGIYQGNVDVYQHGRPIKRTTIRVHVWNFSLPDKSRFKTSNFNTYARIKTMWPTAPTQSALSDSVIREQFMKVAALAAQNKLPSSGFIVNGLDSWNKPGAGDTSMGRPSHKLNNKQWQLDKPNLDNLFGQLARQFCNNYFIAFTSDLHQPPENYAKRKATLEKYLKDFLPYLQGKHVAEQAYIYNIDEPWDDRLVHAKSQYKMLKSLVGDKIKVMQNTNINNNKIIPELIGHFDVLNINLGFYHDMGLARFRKQYPQQLQEVWWNINLWPATRPNVFIEYPLVDARIIGPMSYKFHMQGFEYWELFSASGYENFHPARKNNLKLDWRANSRSLDGNLVYPTEDMDVLSSLRLEALRDGFEDMEYLYLLEQRNPGHPLLNVPVVADISEYENSPEKYLEFRRHVANAIEASH